jgi:hypothetical protein
MCCCLGSLPLEAWLDVLNILFHYLDIDFIVEVNDVFLFTVFESNLQIHILNTPLVLEYVSVLVDDIVEGDLQLRLDLANTVDSTHY